MLVVLLYLLIYLKFTGKMVNLMQSKSYEQYLKNLFLFFFETIIGVQRLKTIIDVLMVLLQYRRLYQSDIVKSVQSFIELFLRKTIVYKYILKFKLHFFFVNIVFVIIILFKTSKLVTLKQIFSVSDSNI